MYKVKVINQEFLGRLIESVKDETKPWVHDDYNACFCGHSNMIAGVAIQGLNHWMEEADNSTDEENKGADMLIAAFGVPSASKTREQAVAVLESIRDTGEFEWPEIKETIV